MNTKSRLQFTASMLAAALLIGASSAKSEPLTVLPTVGPDSGPKTAVTGYLVVYTDTESPINTGDIQYYPHTPYKIYHRDGTLFKSVRNHFSERDEKPARVSLPPGRYTVVGKSETQGDVAVPVVIGALRTTVVNLEKRSHES
ncbi:MAG TPA: hypothetical protein VK961_01565 [Chthoniobacter sp.]|nr:hypothetical protein [Chthoniobacter sp.]